MSMHYNIDLKKKLCEDICIKGKSTLKTAEEYNVPIKTLEKWICNGKLKIDNEKRFADN